MKKGVFLIYKPINVTKPSGIEKKILKQCECFKKVGVSMDTYVVENFPKLSNEEVNNVSSYDLVYFRKQHTVTLKYILALRKIKRNNPKSIIYMDIPTYPYDGEFGNNIRSRVTLFVDFLFRHLLKGVLDKVILTGVDGVGSFCGIKAIKIYNGIELQGLSEINNNASDDIIRIGCIGKFSPWHGYERILIGLSNYYKEGGNRAIKLLFAGDGPELATYKEIAAKLNLEKSVIFCGLLSGAELKGLINQLDFGCCSLGRYKSKLDVIGDLKSRDFLANGLPLITGCDIDILKYRDFPYKVSYPNNNTPLDINKVVEFYDINIKHKKNIVRRRIYDMVSDLINIENTYKPVLDETLSDLQ